MAVAAMVLFVVFLVVVGVVRVWIHQRRTGDTGVRRGPEGRSSVQRRIEYLATVGALGIGVVSPVSALAGLEPVWRSAAGAVVGVGLTIAGTAAAFAAQFAMGDSWRAGVDPGERTELVTSGPFRVVRNPVLSAVLVTCAGLVLMVPTVIGLAGLAAAVVANELLVRMIEEPYLRRVHGQDYLRYAATVGRFVPGIGRIR
jgi:protein-S-isoprenylcysteine O-methyltransferase Ste14